MIDLTKLSAQGRAYSASRAWEVEELDALLLLESKRGLSRPTAADYIRNGIMTLEAFDKATEAQFVPKTPEQEITYGLPQNKSPLSPHHPLYGGSTNVGWFRNARCVRSNDGIESVDVCRSSDIF